MSETLTSSIKRIGFHYFPDSNHYSEKDINTWLPRLQNLGASWLVLQSSQDIAIPQAFLQNLLQASITPIIQHPCPPAQPPSVAQITPLLEAYSHWNIQYVSLFDRPNLRSSWPTDGWGRQDLVDRFLDAFIPLALAQIDLGLTPMLPVLEPGGNYWDTSFLRTVLRALDRRRQSSILDHLALSASGALNGQSLEWGAGGTARWPGARPYFTPEGEQDQRGFRSADWYDSILQEELGHSLPIFLFETGIDSPTHCDAQMDLRAHAETCLNIARLVNNEIVPNPAETEINLSPVPDTLQAACFWLIGADTDSPAYPAAWFQSGGACLPAATLLAEWVNARRNPPEPEPAEEKSTPAFLPERPITHYLLLPTFEWGVSTYYLDLIKPFVQKYRPTIGFSSEEARLAERVTVIGTEAQFPEDILAPLRQSGCFVERIDGDGTTIATKLAER